MDSWKSLNSPYWSDVIHSQVGVFKLVAGWFGISNLRAVVRAARGSAKVLAGSFGLAMSAGVQEGYKHTQLAVNSGTAGRCDMWYRDLKCTNTPQSLQCMMQTWDFDKSFPQGQGRSATTLVPNINDGVLLASQHDANQYCYRVFYQMARVGWTSSDDVPCRLTKKQLWIFHWGYDEGWVVYEVKNGHFPLCGCQCSASSVIFSTKADTSRFITLSVDSLHLQYFHHVIIVHLIPYISILLMNGVHMHSDLHDGRLMVEKPNAYEGC